LHWAWQASWFAAPAAQARVTKIQITSKQSPTFGGYAFKGVGPYEKVVGKAFRRLDPKDPRNAVIVDIGSRQKMPTGRSSTRSIFYILKPIDLGKAITRSCMSRRIAAVKRTPYSIAGRAATTRDR